MAIFNSYVSLPEGILCIIFSSAAFFRAPRRQHRSAHRSLCHSAASRLPEIHWGGACEKGRASCRHRSYIQYAWYHNTWRDVWNVLNHSQYEPTRMLHEWIVFFKRKGTFQYYYYIYNHICASFRSTGTFASILCQFGNHSKERLFGDSFYLPSGPK